MQLITALLATAAIAQAAVLPRSSTGTFELTNFYFTGSPHSLLQTYNFDVTDGSLATHCNTYTSVFPGLGTFPLKACQNPQYSFSFTTTQTPEPGYYLEITEQVDSASQNHTACQFYPANKIVLVENPANPNGNYYQLDSPSSFDLTWTETNEACGA